MRSTAFSSPILQAGRLLWAATLWLVPVTARSHGGVDESSNVWASWPLSPDILLPVFAAAALYVAGVTRRRGRDHGISRWRHASFFGGLAALLVALQSPLDALADHSFTMHQVQHLFLGALGPMLLMLAAPQTLLAAGMPALLRARLLAPLLASRGVRLVFSFFAHPAIASFLMIAVPVFWHLPKFHNLSVLDPPVHYIMHVTMLISGLFFFWRVLDPRPAPQGASFAARIVMSWVVIAGNTPLGAYIALKSTALYWAYDTTGRLWELDALHDEQFGGLLVWVPGGMVFAVLMLIVIRMWGAREDRVDVLRGRGIELRSSVRPSQSNANRRMARRLAAIAAAVGAGVIAAGMLQQFLP